MYSQNKITVKKYLEKIRHLEDRNDNFLHLTANENRVSETAGQFLSSRLSERYYFGGGSNGIVRKKALIALGMEELEDLVMMASQVANIKLSSSLISFNLLSGIHGMIATMLSITEPKDIIMTFNPANGGHFMTNLVLKRIGRKQILTIHKNDSDLIDIERTAKLFKKSKAKALYLDMMSVIEKVPLDELRQAIGKDAIIVFDGSHVLGLIMGGRFQNPLKEGADIIVGNTHKTFPGPQKAIIAFKNKTMGKKTMNLMSQGLYSSIHTNTLIVLALTMLEMGKFGKKYASQIISNSNILGGELEKKGYILRKTSKNEFSQNHQIHIFLDNVPIARKVPFNLYRNRISFNIINPPIGQSYLRLGTQEITRRGMKEKEMVLIADFVDRSIKGEDISREIIKFNNRFRTIFYSFDQIIKL